MSDAHCQGVKPVGSHPRHLYYASDCHPGSHYDGLLSRHRDLLRCSSKFFLNRRFLHDQTATIELTDHPFKVFYTIGFTGVIFCVDVITSDTSSLRNRGIAFAFTSSPNVITAFAGAPLSNQFHETNWRWAYGTICIILPIVALPLIITWELAKRKADREGRLQYKPRSTRTWLQSVYFYIVEFDGTFSFLE